MGNLESWSVRAPRFASREGAGMGFTTPDAVEVTINGERYTSLRHPELARRVAQMINTGHANDATLAGLLGRYLRGEQL